MAKTLKQARKQAAKFRKELPGTTVKIVDNTKRVPKGHELSFNFRFRKRRKK